jgi:hypothetical protein
MNYWKRRPTRASVASPRRAVTSDHPGRRAGARRGEGLASVGGTRAANDGGTKTASNVPRAYIAKRRRRSVFVGRPLSCDVGIRHKTSMAHLLRCGVDWFLHVKFGQVGILLWLARLASILTIFIGWSAC